MNERLRKYLVTRAAMVGIGVGVLALWYVSMVSTPSGYDSFVAKRAAKWTVAPPVSDIARPAASPTQGASAAPAAAIAEQSDIAKALAPAPPFKIEGPLGYMLLNRCVMNLQDMVSPSIQERSKEPRDWEGYPDSGFLRTEVDRGREAATFPTDGTQRWGLTPAEVEKELDRLEEIIYRGSYALQEFDGYKDDSSVANMVIASRWPVLRAVVRGDRAKAAKLLPRWIELELNHHRNTAGGSFPRTLEGANALLLMMASQPGFPQEVLPELQARYEAALLTPAQEQEMLERHFIRARATALELVDDAENRRGNTWHYFLDGGVERVANAAILPGLRKQIDVYTMARIDDDGSTAGSAEMRIQVLWGLGNVAGNIQWVFDTPFTASLRKSKNIFYASSEARRFHPNWDVQKGIVEVALLRHRGDTGRWAERGSELAPAYLTDEFLRGTMSAWRFVEGPAIVRLDPVWLQETLPDGSRLATKPGGLDALTAEDLARPGSVNGLFLEEILRNGWEEKAEMLLPFFTAPGGS